MGDVTLEIKLQNLDERVEKIEEGGGSGITIDSELSTTSKNPVQNKIITAEINKLNTDLASLAKNNASDNLAPNNAVTSTVRGVTIAINEDGTVTTSGQNDGVGTSSVLLCDDYRIPKGTYRLVGTPILGEFQGQAFINIYSKVGTSYTLLGVDNTQGVNITLSQDTDIAIEIVASTKGGTVTGITFKPMLTKDLTATYDDYVKYGGKSNVELTEELSTIKTITATAISGSISFSNIIQYGKMVSINCQFTTSANNISKGTKIINGLPKVKNKDGISPRILLLSNNAVVGCVAVDGTQIETLADLKAYTSYVISGTYICG